MAPWKSEVVDSGPIRSAGEAEWQPLVHGGLCLSMAYYINNSSGRSVILVLALENC